MIAELRAARASVWPFAFCRKALLFPDEPTSVLSHGVYPMDTFHAFLAVVNVGAVLLHISNAITEHRLGIWPTGSLVWIGVSACLATYFGAAAFH